MNEPSFTDKERALIILFDIIMLKSKEFHTSEEVLDFMRRYLTSLENTAKELKLNRN